jgi:ADP-ribose pyrophosphatase YjhB (NUDIX family)
MNNCKITHAVDATRQTVRIGHDRQAPHRWPRRPARRFLRRNASRHVERALHQRHQRARGSGLLLLPSATVVVYDEAGRVLLARDIDSGLWMTVGGAIEPDERPADAARRQFFEETGGRVELVRLIGVFGGPGFRKRYANGDETAYVVTLFEGRIVGGTIAPDGVETSAIAYFARAEMERLDLTSISRALIPYIFAPRDGGRAVYQPPSDGTGM